MRSEIPVGIWTVDTLQKYLHYSRQGTINLLSKLRQDGFVQTKGGGKQIKIYTIDLKRNTNFQNGMFDILNKYAPQKVIPPFEHKVFGNYRVEDALVDLLQIPSIRIQSNVLFLFNHVQDWTYLRKKATAAKSDAHLGLMYDIARMTRKTQRMPKKVETALMRRRPYTIQAWIHEFLPSDKRLVAISQKWNIISPFSIHDLEDLR